MRRAIVLAAVVVLGLAVVSVDAASGPFGYGVAAGEITSTSAILWTRAPSVGKVGLVVSTRASVNLGVALLAVSARAANDRTVAHQGLRRTGKHYWYRFDQDGVESAIGTFRTALRFTSAGTVRFAITGDADATPGANGRPGFNGFQVYARMAAERNDFNINLGDTIYSDSELAGAAVARTVPEKWAKYRLGLALPPLQRLRRSAGLYSHWDDHEFINDFSRAENGAELFRAGLKAFRDYSPVTYSGRVGLYRSVRWGKNLELFFLDERTFRSAKADDAAAATSPRPHPRRFATPFRRSHRRSRTRSLAACLAAISDPRRTMLGSRQYTAFTSAIKASTAVWKVVVNEVPMQQFYALPYDRWEGYAAERERLLRFLQNNAKNVVFLTTDTHANLINEIRYETLGASPESTGMWEVVTGPVATNTFAKEIDSTLGVAGAGTAIGALFFKTQPPRGVGMRCAALDVYSYAEVTVTARRITIAPRDVAGKPVREATGVPCAPLVLTAR